MPGPLPQYPIKLTPEQEAHVDLTRASSAWALLGRRDPRCHDGPWLVHEIRRIDLSRKIFLSHMRALLCRGNMR
jgi:hypothetical protein